MSSGAWCSWRESATSARWRALSAYTLHPGKTVTFPMTFAEFEKARSWEAGGGFYFIAPRSGGKGMRQQDDSVRDEDVDETDFLEY